MGKGVLVSWYGNGSVVIWSNYKLPRSSHGLLIGNSIIMRIVKFSYRDIICGYFSGDLRIWDIVDGVCTRYIPTESTDIINQMKLHMR